MFNHHHGKLSENFKLISQSPSFYLKVYVFVNRIEKFILYGIAQKLIISSYKRFVG